MMKKEVSMRTDSTAIGGGGEVETFGVALRQFRLRRQLTLREFCEHYGFDPGNVSKMERGLLRAPSPDRLADYAEALQLAAGTPDYERFFDLAAVDRNELESVVPDKAVLSRLPALLRTIGDRKLSDDELDKLISFIRKSTRPGESNGGVNGKATQ